MLKSSATESIHSIDETIADDEEQENAPIEGKMFVNQHLIKICFDQETDSS